MVLLIWLLLLLLLLLSILVLGQFLNNQVAKFGNDQTIGNICDHVSVIYVYYKYVVLWFCLIQTIENKCQGGTTCLTLGVLQTWRVILQTIVSKYSSIARADATDGNRHRAQMVQLGLFEIILLLKLDNRLPVEPFGAAVSQSTVPSPLLLL